MTFTLVKRSPSITEYNHLRALAGWPVFEAAVVEEALSNTFFSVCVLNAESQVVGMGRIIGDHAIYMHVQDVIVHPDYQKKGVGKLIMEALLLYVKSAAKKHTNIGLMCSKGREGFYERFGFKVRPSDEFGAGMIMINK